MTDGKLKELKVQCDLVHTLQEKCKTAEGTAGQYGQLNYRDNDGRSRTLYFNDEDKLIEVLCEITRNYFNHRLLIEERRYQSM